MKSNVYKYSFNLNVQKRNRVNDQIYFRFNLIILLSFNVLFFPDFELLLASIYIEP